ncbi:prion protein, related sequence 3 [Denticeps clupeoides]|uniref:Prion protein n=1 Tax=Denticeps clupeoides TaxID=299321 RepID=A0AAY4DYJ6_9TELE|nr:calcium-binding protein P-like [Denticeps clupeoides]
MARLTLLFLLLAALVSVTARRGGGGGFKSGGLSWGRKTSSTGTRGSSTGGSSSSRRPSQTQSQAGSYPRQPQNPNPPPYPGGGAPPPYPGAGPPPPYPGLGRASNQHPHGSYPGAGYPNQYPGRAGANPYPVGGSYPGYPVRGGSNPVAGAGGYPGGNPNWNPNNKIMSPGYGGGYGGYGHGYGAGGSPFAQSVHGMGYSPSLRSKGFGKQAVLAAGAGAMAGMALGYGLGSFTRPHFAFHSPQEEYYYNHYLYRRYGQRSPDGRGEGHGGGATGGSPGGREPPPAFQNTPPQEYDKYMDACMKRDDLLPGQRRQTEQQGGDVPKTPPETNSSAPPTPEGEDESQNGTQGDSGVTEGADMTEAVAAEEDDEDLVSVVEIGYPALIEQLKARRCVELFMAYSERLAQQRVADGRSLDFRSRGQRYGPLGPEATVLLASGVSLVTSYLVLH